MGRGTPTTPSGEGGHPEPVRVALLTVSDAGSRGKREDRSGDEVARWCQVEGYRLVHRELVPDETSRIVPLLLDWADGGEVDVILTTGGTGFTSRDVTPEATRAVVERPARGLAEALVRHGETSTPFAVLSRGEVGIRGRTLIVNLPGSTGGVRDGISLLEPLLAHVRELLAPGAVSHDPPEESHE